MRANWRNDSHTRIEYVFSQYKIMFIMKTWQQQNVIYSICFCYATLQCCFRSYLLFLFDFVVVVAPKRMQLE